ncbi:hypothetical protein OVA11_19555 [Caulobacter sp. SL161]|uniref:hypothetical protein n=1 Tax=Caulobacter sp. SL161 TaxID=2995156 RepID=UPI0022743B05|nr:hypothetical protein [Caulobacter sp. SL161]MCY1649174.1 hypothetical protein [Caulobacter sp. SL161]
MTTPALAQGRARPQPAFELASQGHLKVLTATAWNDVDGLSVSGLVRRAPLWKAGVQGRLDVEAYDAAGARLGASSVVWRGSLGGGGHNHPARYQAHFPGLSAGQVARVTVRYSPVAHAAEPSEAAR